MFSKSLVFMLLATLCSTPASAEEITVQKLVDKALHHNPEIAAYTAEIDAAKAAHAVAGLPQNPEVSFGLGRNKVSSPTGDITGSAYTASIDQPIDWPGRFSLREAIARQDITLAELGLERFTFHLASQVRVLAQHVAANRRMANAAVQISQRYDALKETMGERQPAGIAPQLELNAIEAATLVAQSRANEAEITLQSTLLELQQLTGVAVSEETRLSGTDFTLQKLPADTALFRKAAEHNYDIRMKRAELEQQGFKVSLAKNERYPTFTVGPFISQENGSEDQTIVGMNFSVPIPVWDSGAAKVRSALAQQHKAEAALNLQQKNVERRLAEASLVYRTHQKNVKTFNLDKLRDAASEAERHYQLGGVEISTYITMQDKYLEAVEAMNSAKIKALEAGLLIEEITGSPGSVVKQGKGK